MKRGSRASRVFAAPVRHGAVAGLVAALALLAGCSEQDAGAKPAPPQPPPARVTVVQVESRALALTRVYPARAQAAEDVEVRAQVRGILVERNYDEGSRVEKGAVLFRIDPAPYAARVQQAEAERQRARAQLRQAEREWKRVAALFKENAVSARQRDEAQSVLELAQAAVANADAALRVARIDLGYTQVTAPIAGVTGLREVSEGNLIEPGALLTTVRRLDPIQVLFSLPEGEALAQRRQLKLADAATGPGQRLQARALLPEGGAYEQPGAVDFIAANVDPMTGTVQARAVFPNPQGALVPGQFLRIEVQGLELPDVIVVPAQAIAEGPEGTIVYTVDEQNVARPQPVILGQALGPNQVITEGLRGGERVIVSGIAGVRPGQPVQVAAQTTTERTAQRGPASSSNNDIEPRR